jgi:hypothetical protein
MLRELIAVELASTFAKLFKIQTFMLCSKQHTTVPLEHFF